MLHLHPDERLRIVDSDLADHEQPDLTAVETPTQPQLQGLQAGLMYNLPRVQSRRLWTLSATDKPLALSTKQKAADGQISSICGLGLLV